MYGTLWGQTAPNETILRSSKDFEYVVLKGDTVFLHLMRVFFFKLGDYKCLRDTDTLSRDANHSFRGKKYSIVFERKGWLLTQKGEKKVRKIPLDTVKNLKNAYYILNQAYYLTQHSKMSDELGKLYSFNPLHSVESYHHWLNLPMKEVHYLDFRELANNDIAQIKQATIQKLDKYENITKFVAQNAKTATYEILRDSLSKLSSKKDKQPEVEKWRYYLKTVHEIAEQRPEFFFKLAEDLPDAQHDIFFSVNMNEKALLAKLIPK
jgi:hypothetical protein